MFILYCTAKSLRNMHHILDAHCKRKALTILKNTKKEHWYSKTDAKSIKWECKYRLTPSNCTLHFNRFRFRNRLVRICSRQKRDGQALNRRAREMISRCNVTHPQSIYIRKKGNVHPIEYCRNWNVAQTDERLERNCRQYETRPRNKIRILSRFSYLLMLSERSHLQLIPSTWNHQSEHQIVSIILQTIT